MSLELNRRLVMGAAAATAAGVSGPAFGQTQRPYRVGVVGAGWFGKLNLNALMAVAPIETVAMCDVDQDMLRAAREATAQRHDTLRRQRRPAIYRDYRRMLDAHEFDIVIVATPDHWHTLPAIAALQQGAHVYIEKPVSVDVVEGQALVAAARAANRVVQVGTQRRVIPQMVEAKERIVRAGLLGKIGHVDTFCYFHQRPAQFSAPSTPPSNLDWDMYCGPAPLLPYRTEMHPRDWRAFRAFGNGYLGDVGVHMIDLARWMLDLGWPKHVTSAGGVMIGKDSPADVPDTQVATFTFDDFLMTWTNRHWGPPPQGEVWGFNVYGERGVLRVASSSYVFTPREGGETIAGNMEPEPRPFGPHPAEEADWRDSLTVMTRANMRDFLRAIETGGRPTSDIEEGHISTACCYLANLSLELGRPFDWDASAQRIVSDDEANERLARPYRAPWVHP